MGGVQFVAQFASRQLKTYAYDHVRYSTCSCPISEKSEAYSTVQYCDSKGIPEGT
jgi:hypothetical protein